jgi:dTDP-4-dehydrorhamnose 3,5-epimerase
MEITSTSLNSVLLVKPKAHKDSRGFFVEAWQKARYEAHGIRVDWAQDNVSSSVQGVLRGLHFQSPRSQAKLITVLHGEIFDVVVDVRAQSPTFGEWVSARLSSENLHQLWIPQGFAHGFLVTSPTAIVSYKASDFYYPEDEISILWNDPDLGIEWPLSTEPTISQKDQKGRRLKDLSLSLLPPYLS